MEQNENETDCIVCEKESRLDGILNDRGRASASGHESYNGKNSTHNLGVIIGSHKLVLSRK